MERRYRTNQLKKDQILKKLWNYRELCLKHVYSEPDSDIHQMVMNHIIPKIIDEHDITTCESILDVGCGQGYGMEKFTELGCENISGITLSKEDAKVARKRGFKVKEDDMTFQSSSNEEHDFMFVRHCLEHSPYPLLTLLEFYRVLQPGGKIYIEMPSPRCTRPLEEYDNHYAIMGPRQWVALFKRAGFNVMDIGEMAFDINEKESQTDLGKEIYEWYILEKSV